MKNTSLVIGNTSQLSHYFPEEYEKISSRRICLNCYENKFYDRIFFCFGENRTFLEDILNECMNVNVFYTLRLLLFFRKRCNKLIVYGSSELWNNCTGGVDINTPMNFNPYPYVISKKILVDSIKTLNFDNIIIIHPFNFNSIYRKGNFLFGKIYDSILNKKKVEIGNTDFYRDLVSPEYVAKRSMVAEKDEVVGSGKLTHVNTYIRELYKNAGLNYDDYVIEKDSYNLNLKRNEFYSK